MSLLAGLSQQGDSIADAQPLDSDLTALAGLSTTGLVARTGAGTAATRTITGTANQVTVTNGDGISGNPTLALPQSIATTSTPQFARVGLGAAADSTSLLNLNGARIHGTSTGVGIGTTAPAGALDVFGSVFSRGTVPLLFFFRELAGGSGSVGDTMGGVGFGVDVTKSTYGSATGAQIYGELDAIDGTYRPKGRIRIATSDGAALVERLRIDSGGALKLSAYGAGTLVTDSSGNVTASSDRRLKNVSGKFTRGLDAIMQIQPKVFTWKPESGMNPDDVNVGFIAQDVQPAIPEAVGSMKTVDTEEDDGTGTKVKKSKREASEYLTLSDRPLIAALVNAVRELNEKNTALEARVAALENGKASK